MARKTKNQYAPLDQEQLDALREFADRYEGQDWKSKLNLAWMRASEPGVLQALRNSHGPSWLADFELPEGQ